MIIVCEHCGKEHEINFGFNATKGLLSHFDLFFTCNKCDEESAVTVTFLHKENKTVIKKREVPKYVG